YDKAARDINRLWRDEQNAGESSFIKEREAPLAASTIFVRKEVATLGAEEYAGKYSPVPRFSGASQLYAPASIDSSKSPVIRALASRLLGRERETVPLGGETLHIDPRGFRRGLSGSRIDSRWDQSVDAGLSGKLIVPMKRNEDRAASLLLGKFGAHNDSA